MKIGPEIERGQIESVRRMRAGRDEAAAHRALERLKAAAMDEGENLIPPMVDCARAYCTEGEIVNALREVFGEYTETPRF
jgi:methylmalonyl-CoA mutase N-terminal domain/subunit